MESICDEPRVSLDKSKKEEKRKIKLIREQLQLHATRLGVEFGPLLFNKQGLTNA